jgi:hypothetical protein
VQEIEKISAMLDLEDVTKLFHRRPLLLDSARVGEALASLEAMLPSKYDARQMLIEMPSLIYEQNRQSLPSHLIDQGPIGC